MAVKRDYGSFAKASTRLLTPQIESLGYRLWYGGGFGREKAGRVEGFFLQQSQWGSGDFCVNIGIHVPGLDDLWGLDHEKRVFGLLIAWRLSDAAAAERGGDHWYQARDREQLESSLKVVAATLARDNGWFDQFRTFSDVLEQYRARSALPKEPTGDLPDVRVLNYGLLLLLNGAKQEAWRWLRFAGNLLARPIFWDSKSRTFSHDAGPGLKPVKPTKDHELRRRVIDSALARAES